MYDCSGHEFHTLSTIKHLKAEILSDGGQWSNLCQFSGPSCEKVWEPLIWSTWEHFFVQLLMWQNTLWLYVIYIVYIKIDCGIIMAMLIA